ncbi:MAG: hypothetical protein WBM44_07045, partial [Waterburya sp.]
QATRKDGDIIGSNEDLESEIDFVEFEDFPTDNSTGADTGLLQDTGMVHKNFFKEEEINTIAATVTTETGFEEDALDELDFEDFLEDDSTGDTGLLHDTGLIHGSPLKEEEINFNTFTISEIESEIVESPDLDLNDNSFAQYCFVTNKKLLTSDIIPPGKEIMRLVKFFHHLSENNQHKLLPILDSYFLHAEAPNLEKMAIAIQKWFKQIGELNYDDRQMVAIWLSRYCFDTETTLEEFKAIAAQHATVSMKKKAKGRSTEYSFTSLNSNPSSAKSEQPDELTEKGFHLPPIFKKLILPGVWILATVILLVLGIMSNNSTTIIASQQIPSLCSNTIGSTNYCRLAVNLAGEKTIAQPPKSLFPLTEVTETVATYGCERYANLKAKISSNIAPEQTPVRSSYGEKIFPHIYVISAEQKNVKQGGHTKVGCVYTTGQGQRSPKLLAADIIPSNWPTEHYQKQARLNANLSFGIFTKPINLGLYTIFAALGIALASWSNMGIKINHPQTIYLVALILGIVQVISSSITSTFLGIVGTVALPILAIFIASLLIKDFQINWNRGYPLIATSVLMMIAIQFLFYVLCLGLINGLV